VPGGARSLLAGSPDLIAVHDPDGTIRWASPSSRAVLGSAPGALVGTPIVNCVHPDDADRVRARLFGSETADGAGPAGVVGVTCRMRHGDGHFVRVEMLVRPVERDGTTAALQSAIRPVAHRSGSGAGPRRREARLRAGLQLSDTAVFNQDADLRYTWVYNNHLGVSPTTMLGCTDADLLPAGEAEPLTATKREALATGLPTRGTFRMTTTRGTRQFEVYVEPMRNAAGQVIGLTGAARDVTETDPGPGRLGLDGDQALDILGSITDGFFALDRQERFLYVNKAAASVFGRAPNELLGKPIWSLLPDLRDTRLRDVVERAQEYGVPSQVTDYLEPLDVWLRAKAFPFDDGVSVTLIDATDEHDAQMAFFRGQQRAAHLLESIEDAFFAVDDDWRFTYVNERAEALLQRSSEELLGENIWEAFPDAVGSRFEAQYRRAMREQTAVSFTEHYQPLNLWARVRAFPYSGGLSVHFSDVTEQKETEAALRETTRRHQLVLEAAGLGEINLNLEDGSFERSESVDRFFGFDPDDDVGGHVLPFARRVHPDDLPALRAAVERAADSADGWSHTFRVRPPDGAVRSLEAKGRTIVGDDGAPRLIGVLDEQTAA
jgi:PAS domain S-box-containing protein